MTINVSDMVMGAPQRSPVTAQQPVRNVDLGGIGNIFTMVERHDAQARADAKFQQDLKDEAANNSIVGMYYQQASKVALARRQGTMTEQQAYVELDKIRNGVLAKFPEYQSEVLDFANRFYEIEGLGTFIKTGNEEEQAREKVTDKLVLEGIVRPDATVQEKEAAVDEWYANQQEAKKLELETKRFRNREASADADMAELQLEERRLSNQAKSLTTKLSRTYVSRMANKGRELLDLVEANPGNPEVLTQAKATLYEMRQGARRFIQDVGLEADKEYSTKGLALVDEMYNYTLKMLNNEISTETYEQITKNRKAVDQWRLTNDPTLRQSMAFHDAMPYATSWLSPFFAPKITEAAQSMSQGFFTPQLDPAADGALLDGVEETVGALLDKDKNSLVQATLTESKVASIRDVFNATLKGFGVRSALTDKPTDWTKSVKFLASDKVGSYIAEYGGILDQENMQKAKDVIQAQYNNKVIPAIKEALEEPIYSSYSVRNGFITKIFELVDVKWTPQGVRLVPREEVGTINKYQLEDSRKLIEPVLTNMVKASTHLEGNNDYQKVFDVVMSEIISEFGDHKIGEGTRSLLMGDSSHLRKPSDVFMETLGDLEGTSTHEDHKGIKTAPYGLVIDEEKNKSAFARNKAIADKYGKTLDENISKSDARFLSSMVAEQIDTELSEEVPEYAALSPDSKAIVIDAKYNTGVTYKNLIAALTELEASPNRAGIDKVVKESRRVSGGQPMAGLDNRVAKLLYARGFIESLDEAKKYGLTLANTNEVPRRKSERG